MRCTLSPSLLIVLIALPLLIVLAPFYLDSPSPVGEN